jgi:hypothetical protein
MNVGLECRGELRLVGLECRGELRFVGLECRGESRFVSSAGQCSAGQFRCHNDRCIPDNQTCDGTNDCSDGSDEAQCKEGMSLSAVV